MTSKRFEDIVTKAIELARWVMNPQGRITVKFVNYASENGDEAWVACLPQKGRYEICFRVPDDIESMPDTLENEARIASVAFHEVTHIIQDPFTEMLKDTLSENQQETIEERWAYNVMDLMIWCIIKAGALTN
jgi:hypothetical protein